MFVGRPPDNYDRLLDFSRPATGSLFFVPSGSFLDNVGTEAPAETESAEESSADPLPAAPLSASAALRDTSLRDTSLRDTSLQDTSLKIGSLKGEKDE
jgi:putative iron-dependent peroxidase